MDKDVQQQRIMFLQSFVPDLSSSAHCPVSLNRLVIKNSLNPPPVRHRSSCRDSHIRLCGPPVAPSDLSLFNITSEIVGHLSSISLIALTPSGPRNLFLRRCLYLVSYSFRLSRKMLRHKIVWPPKPDRVKHECQVA